MTDESWQQIEECFTRLPSFQPELREAMLFRIAGNRSWDSPWARLQAIGARDNFIVMLRSTIQTISDAALEQRTLEAIEKAIPEENTCDKRLINSILSSAFGSSRHSNHTTVLFLAAEPTDQGALRLGKEFREIQDAVASHRGTDAGIVLEMPQLAARSKDLLIKVLGFRPNVVHFSGHGDETGGLQFEAQDGRSHRIDPEGIATFFAQCTKYTQCVVLNACHSSLHAKEISKHIPFAIGMNNSIGNSDAIRFSLGFYATLAQKPSEFEAAFVSARNMLLLDNSAYYDTPELYQQGRQMRFANVR